MGKLIWYTRGGYRLLCADFTGLTTELQEAATEKDNIYREKIIRGVITLIRRTFKLYYII